MLKLQKRGGNGALGQIFLPLLLGLKVNLHVSIYSVFIHVYYLFICLFISLLYF